MRLRFGIRDKQREKVPKDPKKRPKFTAFYCPTPARHVLSSVLFIRNTAVYNVVGYNMQDVAAGKFAMVGVQFTGVGADAISIQDFITGITGPDFDSSASTAFKATAPQIQVWKGSSYTFYYYLNTTRDGKKGWANTIGNYANVTFAPGTAVWFKAYEACTITTAGQILSADAATVTCTNGKFTMAANAQPVALNLNNPDQVTYESLTGPDFDSSASTAFKATAPQIQVWKGSSYTFYYYLNTTRDGKKGWANTIGNYVSTAAIPVGSGFWVKATTGDFTITFVK